MDSSISITPSDFVVLGNVAMDSYFVIGVPSLSSALNAVEMLVDEDERRVAEIFDLVEFGPSWRSARSWAKRQDGIQRIDEDLHKVRSFPAGEDVEALFGVEDLAQLF